MNLGCLPSFSRARIDQQTAWHPRPFQPSSGRYCRIPFRFFTPPRQSRPPPKLTIWNINISIYRTLELSFLFKFRKPGPLGQVRATWLCRRLMPWNDGILECWNNGFRRMKSYFDTPHKSEINPPAVDRFLYPRFHYSTIPSFHWTSQGKLHPSGVKSKPGPPSGL